MQSLTSLDRRARAIGAAVVVAALTVIVAASVALASAGRPTILPVEPDGGIGGVVDLPVEPNGGIGN